MIVAGVVTLFYHLALCFVSLAVTHLLYQNRICGARGTAEGKAEGAARSGPKNYRLRAVFRGSLAGPVCLSTQVDEAGESSAAAMIPAADLILVPSRRLLLFPC